MNTNNLVPRQIAVRSAGQRHGPITRLMSPGDIGELVKPFVFLDYVDAPGGGGKVPVNPEYVLSHNADRVVIRNFEGRVFEYPEADDGTPRIQPLKRIEEPHRV